MSSRIVVALVVVVAGCGSDQTLTGSSGLACTTVGERRCDGDDVQVCGESNRWVREERCATRCEAGACTAPTCSPGATRCDGQDVQQCNERGTAWVFRQACFTGCSAGACVATACSPWSRRCNGLDVEECDERGAAWRRVETCSAACEGGTCITTRPCTEGARRCNARFVEECFGGVWRFRETCEATTCIDGACALCVPGATRCSGADAQRCATNGSVWDVVETCRTACVDGRCASCNPGERQCVGSTVQICAADGSGFVPASYCATRCEAGACAPPVCAPGAVRCDAGNVQVCNSGGSWVTTESCEYGCTAGRCTVCTAGTLRCSGDAVEACASDGTSWSFVRHCATGCTAGVCNPFTCTPGARRCDGLAAQLCDATGTVWTTIETCATACTDGRCIACTAGSLRCSGSAVEACASDGSAWSFVQYCATGCTAGACNPLTCSPLARRCNGRSVEVCNPTGTAWTTLETCTVACRDGVCSGSTGGVCVPGTYRCTANDVEACDSVGGGWFYIQTCLEGCSAGACSGSACMPFTLTAVPAGARADGESSVLVYSAPIVDVRGTPLPDGTMIVINTTAGTLLAADADPVTTEREVATFRGRADAVLRAPSAAATATVRFAVRGASRCTGETDAAFPDATTANRSAGADFTTIGIRDTAATTAFWDTALGRLTAGTTTFGFGEDGDLVVTGSYNLNTSVRAGRTRPDAVQFRVAFIEANSVTLDALPNGLSPGDDVLLINLQGSAASNTSVGNYEVLTVLRTEGLRVFFVSPIRGTYGVGGNTDLTGQR
ncbi:MAG: hypothetical protein QME96_08040, partial [Myxococcota bacterium]|nr:hypothetical protein [Myxococcota bacterium]